MGDGVAPAFGFGARDGGGLAVVDAHAVKPARMHQPAGAGVGDIVDGEIVLAFRRNDTGDGQLIFPGEIQIALVMRRAAENRAGAIIHQHEIGDEHRQQDGGIERVQHRQPGIIALLFLALDIGSRGATGLGFGNERRQPRICLGQRRT